MDEDKPQPVIVFCPCCAASVDAVHTQREFVCQNCDQVWSMVINLAVLQQYAL